MDKFTGATIMLGAVTETTSLKETVETLVRICDKDDIKEISVCYSPRTTKESMAVVNELANADYPIKIVAFMQKRPFMLINLFLLIQTAHLLIQQPPNMQKHI